VWVGRSPPHRYSSSLSPSSLPSLDLQGLNFQLGVGVQAAVRARFEEPVNHYPIHGLKESSCWFSGEMQVSTLISLLGKFFRLQLAALWLILGHSGSLIVFISLLLLSRMLDFISTTSDHSPVTSTRFFFHLWSNGGAHWVSESQKFFREQNEQWITVQ
jgi:hypothetical protein